jgi:2-amino-4-hydroxy-6-hydroxymethyldihydropteridine diphosphokinase
MKVNEKLAIIGLGGNLGRPRDTFARACTLLQQRAGTINARSSLYTTAALLAQGISEPQPDYLNAVVGVTTLLSPFEILNICCDIERELGRTRSPIVRWAPRTIDLDLLAVDDLVISKPGLTLPHPQLHLRDFVLEPLCEIAPDWRHPIINKTASELLEEYGTRSSGYIKAKEPFA